MKRILCLLVALMVCVGSVFATDEEDGIPIDFIYADAVTYAYEYPFASLQYPISGTLYFANNTNMHLEFLHSLANGSSSSQMSAYPVDYGHFIYSGNLFFNSLITNIFNGSNEPSLRSDTRDIVLDVDFSGSDSPPTAIYGTYYVTPLRFGVRYTGRVEFLSCRAIGLGASQPSDIEFMPGQYNAVVNTVSGLERRVPFYLGYLPPVASSISEYTSSGIFLSTAIDIGEPIRDIAFYFPFPLSKGTFTVASAVYAISVSDSSVQYKTASTASVDISPILDWLNTHLLPHINRAKDFFSAVNAYLSSISLYVQHIDLNVDAIKTDTSAIKTAVQNMRMYVISSDATLTNISKKLDTLISDVSMLPGSLEVAQEQIYSKIAGAAGAIGNLFDSGNLFPSKDKSKDSVTQSVDAITGITDKLGVGNMDVDVNQSLDDAFAPFQSSVDDGPLMWFSPELNTWFDGPNAATYSGPPMDFADYMAWYNAQIAARKEADGKYDEEEEETTDD